MIQDMVKIAVKALDSKKGVDIKVIKIDKLTTFADYFVICTGTSSTHVKALADECEYALTSAGYQPHHTEGFGSNSWILLDFKDLIVHVYDKQAREFYDLERYWKDGTEIDANEFLEDK